MLNKAHIAIILNYLFELENYNKWKYSSFEVAVYVKILKLCLPWFKLLDNTP